VSYDGKAKTSGVLATGDKLQLRYKDSGSIYNTYNIVIYGDVNGDGDITIIDLLRVQKHLLNTSKLSGAFLTAADVSKDGAVTILDLLRVQKHLLGTAYIQQ
ncbi:MAG TPA: mannosyl-glycoprotein endo-beta-N-acetylglucosamidase, partial [Syntrophomonadaceae bacterium]|nr:mannosyl-glycoprotein endo-beta-N-acetylglucosamidase [Syntrophomonadaceae bacterium]